MTDNNERPEVAITVTDDLWTCERVYGANPKQLVLRAGRDRLGEVLIKALADLTGNQILAKLSLDELDVAVTTLGAFGVHGLDADLYDEMSEPQHDILTKTGQAFLDATQ